MPSCNKMHVLHWIPIFVTVQKTYSNMAASEKLIRDGSISVLFMSDAREVT